MAKATITRRMTRKDGASKGKISTGAVVTAFKDGTSTSFKKTVTPYTSGKVSTNFNVRIGKSN